MEDLPYDLILRLDGVGIDMSISPEQTKKQLDELYETTRYNTFGYIEDLESFNKIFEPVYGIEFFILIRDLKKEYDRYVIKEGIPGR